MHNKYLNTYYRNRQWLACGKNTIMLNYQAINIKSKQMTCHSFCMLHLENMWPSNDTDLVWQHLTFKWHRPGLTWPSNDTDLVWHVTFKWHRPGLTCDLQMTQTWSDNKWPSNDRPGLTTSDLQMTDLVWHDLQMTQTGSDMWPSNDTDWVWHVIFKWHTPGLTCDL